MQNIQSQRQFNWPNYKDPEPLQSQTSCRMWHSRGIFTGVVSGMITAKELHRRMGHIAPEAAKRLITEGSIKGIILDNTTVIKNCASCIHAKTHWKAIHKIHKEPRAAEFSDEIH